MPRTTNKGVRFTDDELTRIEKLRAQLTEYSSEADLLHHAALLGILVLATYATRPDMVPYAGYGADDLAALLKPRLMPAIDFLIARGALPMVFTMQLTSGLGAATTAIADSERDGETMIDAAVADDLESLGSGFMDDD